MSFWSHHEHPAADHRFHPRPRPPRGPARRRTRGEHVDRGTVEAEAVTGIVRVDELDVVGHRPAEIALEVDAIPIIALVAFGASQNFPFGGTAILIVVGVGLDTAKQIESQLQQRSYEGFLK